MNLEQLQPLWHEAEISLDAHVVLIRRHAKAFAKAVGFSKKKIEDIVLCVSELAQNHIDHETISGKLRLFGQKLLDNTSIFSIASLDSGPGIEEFRNGFQPVNIKKKSIFTGLGQGLHCVKRLSDEFAICSGKLGLYPCPDLLSGSKEITTLIAAFFNEPSYLLPKIPVSLSYLIRPIHEDRFCGDGISIKFSYPFLRISVIDALGKGEDAAKIALLSREILEYLPPELELEDLFYELGKGLLGTRGVMALITRLDLEKGRVDVSGIGNVAQFIYKDGSSSFVSGTSGILGRINTKNSFFKKSYSNFREIMGIIFTDGIKNIPRLEFKQSIGYWHPLLWVNYLFSTCLKQTDEDDATMVVWKWKK